MHCAITICMYGLLILWMTTNATSQVVLTLRDLLSDTGRLSLAEPVDGVSVPDYLIESLYTSTFLHLSTSPVANKDYNVSDLCLNHTETIFDALGRMETWAIQLVDAAGKLPSGVLEGDLLWLGRYSLCINTTADVVSGTHNGTAEIQHPFRGQYCLVTIANTDMPTSKTVLKIGLCVSDSCSGQDTRALVNSGLYSLPKDVEAVSVVCQRPSSPLDGPAIAMIAVLSILCFFVVVGTVIDVVVYPSWLQSSTKLHVMGLEESSEASSGSILRAEEYTPLLDRLSGQEKQEHRCVGDAIF